MVAVVVAAVVVVVVAVVVVVVVVVVLLLLACADGFWQQGRASGLSSQVFSCFLEIQAHGTLDGDQLVTNIPVRDLDTGRGQPSTDANVGFEVRWFGQTEVRQTFKPICASKPNT